MPENDIFITNGIRNFKIAVFYILVHACSKFNQNLDFLFIIDDQFEVRGSKPGKLSNTGNSILSSLLGLAGNWNTPPKKQTTSKNSHNQKTNQHKNLKTYNTQKQVQKHEKTVQKTNKIIQKPTKQKSPSKCRWSSKMRRIVCTNTSNPKPTVKTTVKPTFKPKFIPKLEISKPKPTVKPKKHFKPIKPAPVNFNSWQCPAQSIPNGKSMVIRKGRIHRYKCDHGKRLKGKRFQICNCANKPSKKPQNCADFALSGTTPVCY